MLNRWLRQDAIIGLLRYKLVGLPKQRMNLMTTLTSISNNLSKSCYNKTYKNNNRVNNLKILCPRSFNKMKKVSEFKITTNQSMKMKGHPQCMLLRGESSIINLNSRTLLLFMLIMKIRVLFRSSHKSQLPQLNRLQISTSITMRKKPPRRSFATSTNFEKQVFVLNAELTFAIDAYLCQSTALIQLGISL